MLDFRRSGLKFPILGRGGGGEVSTDSSSHSQFSLLSAACICMKMAKNNFDFVICLS